MMTQLFAVLQNPILQNTKNDDLALMFNWSIANRLSLNSDMTKCTLFHPKHRKISIYLDAWW